tara:strand:+ start:101 stop:406 length:306 start_codon:yes stop_codon:yes gene_type:complete
MVKAVMIFPHAKPIEINVCVDKLHELMCGPITILGQTNGHEIPIVYVANAQLQNTIEAFGTKNRYTPKRFGDAYGPILSLRMDAGIAYDLPLDELMNNYKT